MINGEGIKELIAGLGSPIPGPAVAAAQEITSRREETVPGLLRLLERTVDVPAGAPVLLDYRKWLATAFLLAQFGEKKTVPLLVRQFSMPPDHVDDLFEDILTEDLHRIFATLCADDWAPLKGMIESEKVNGWVRDACFRALTILVAAGRVPRPEILGYFTELFAGRLKRVPSQAWDALASACAELHAVELREELEKAYGEELVDPGFIAWEDVESEWARQPDESLEKFLRVNGGLITDTPSEMSDWFPEEAGVEKPAAGVFHEGSTFTRAGKKTGRNDPCPCGSGKKFKKCCGS